MRFIVYWRPLERVKQDKMETSASVAAAGGAGGAGAAWPCVLLATKQG